MAWPNVIDNLQPWSGSVPVVIDFQSMPPEPLALEARVVQFNVQRNQRGGRARRVRTHAA